MKKRDLAKQLRKTQRTINPHVTDIINDMTDDDIIETYYVDPETGKDIIPREDVPMLIEISKDANDFKQHLGAYSKAIVVQKHPHLKDVHPNDVTSISRAKIVALTGIMRHFQ